MSVKVYNFSCIKDLPKVIDIGLSDVSLSDILDYLESEYQSELKKTLLFDGKLTEKARVSINGRSVYDLDVIIPDCSQLMFSLVLPGG